MPMTRTDIPKITPAALPQLGAGARSFENASALVRRCFR